MEIKRNGSQPSGKGPDQYFTGNVRIDPRVDAPEPTRILAASVTFEPGARIAWHTHPLGQTLSGCGWTQCWGEPKEEIRPRGCDLVPAGEEAVARSHGNDSHDAYCHRGKLDGKAVDWMERAGDEQYFE